ncbi:hypothetical protein ACFL4G_10895 [Thermodesulfobacteriota bacterium]
MSHLKDVLEKHTEWSEAYQALLSSHKDAYERHLRWVNDPTWNLTELQREILAGIINYYEEALIITELEIEATENTLRETESLIRLMSERKIDTRQILH